jgi:hypothetical protein
MPLPILFSLNRSLLRIFSYRFFIAKFYIRPSTAVRLKWIRLTWPADYVA